MGVVLAGGAPVAPPAVALPDGPSGRAYLIGLLTSLCAALLVVFGVLDVLSGQIVDRQGLSWPLSLRFGPSFHPTLVSQAWSATYPDPQPRKTLRFGTVLGIHLIVDAVYIAAYTALAVQVLRALSVSRRAGRVLVGLLVAADVTEDLSAIAALCHSRLAIAVQPWLTLVKWLSLLALVLVAVLTVLSRGARSHRVNRSSIGRAWESLVFQRVSFLPSVVLAVLTVLAGSPILEQLPDAQRGWIDHGPLAGQGVAAAVALGLVTSMVWAVTRVRNVYSLRCYVATQSRTPPPPKQARLRDWWYGAVVVVVLGAVALGVRGGGWAPADAADVGKVQLARTVAFLALPIVVVSASALLRLTEWLTTASGHAGLRTDYLRPTSVEQLRANVLAGNVATVSVVVVGGLGLVRAFTPVAVLYDTVLPAATQDSQTISLLGAVAWLVAGSGAVALPWLVLRRRAAKPVVSAWWALRPSARVGRVVLLACGVVFFALAFFPTLAARLGLAAVASLSIGALVGMLAGLGLILQDRPPADVLSALGLRRTPLITALVLTVVLVGAVSGHGSIHRVDPGPPMSQAPGRVDLSTTFGSWLKEKGACTIDVPMGPGGQVRQVRPMLMVAAEGGGIRAAYWTVLGLAALSAKAPCAAHAVLFSAGASGGSVGLTVARFSGRRDAPQVDQAVAAVQEMSKPSTLSAAADGTFVRDVFYGATGVPLPDLGGPGPDWAWKDRGRLIEQGWAASYGPRGPVWGSRSFLGDDDLSPATGALVLNSSDVGDSCRTWVSQVALGGDATTLDGPATLDPSLTCDRADGPGPRTTDLFSAYGPDATSTGDRSDCLGDVTAVTAALLTARFPYVTPGAVVGPCPKRHRDRTGAMPYWPSTQLVDGGYLENTGLATITDLAPRWLDLVRRHNEAAAEPGSTDPFVLPVVVFLANGDAQSAVPRLDQGPTNELYLPISTFTQGESALSDTGTMLARAQQAVTIDRWCPTEAGSSAGDACQALNRAFDHRVVVVDRFAEPEIAPPLGWTLSDSSRRALEHGMDQQVDATCTRSDLDQNPVPPVCQHDEVPLGDLVRLLRRP